jgi:hypothetical protein
MHIRKVVDLLCRIGNRVSPALEKTKKSECHRPRHEPSYTFAIKVELPETKSKIETLLFWKQTSIVEEITIIASEWNK